MNDVLRSYVLTSDWFCIALPCCKNDTDEMNNIKLMGSI